MPRSRVLAVASAIAAVSLATLLVASPAQAATLPAGQRITVIDDYYGDVWTADPASAALTFVGDGTSLGESEYMTGADVNDDGFGYAISTERTGEDPYGDSFVFTFDANTGTLTDRDQISIPDHQSLALGCQALDLAPNGTLYTVCFEANGTDEENDEDLFLTIIGTLDPSNGNLTPIVTIEGDQFFTAMATNPVTGVMWMFDWDFAGFGDTYTWDLTASEPDQVADLGGPAWGADFDRDGQLFVTSWETPVMAPKPALKTLDPSSGFYIDAGLYTIEGEQLDDGQAPPLTVWGKPALPATGPVDVVPFGLGAVLLLVAGGAFVLLQRRRASA